jgi:hypothetical protein
VGNATATWILSYEEDPDYSDFQRRRNHRMLTDRELLRWGAKQDYDETIRALDLVWECPTDGTVNVTGFRCWRCGSRRAR